MYSIRRIPARFFWLCLLALSVAAGGALGQQTDSPPQDPPAAETPEPADEQADQAPAAEAPEDPEEESPEKAAPPEEAPQAQPQESAPEEPQETDPQEGADEPAEEDAEDSPDEDAEDETRRLPERKPVTWDDQIAAVVGKEHPENADDLRAIQNQVREVVQFARPATVAVQIGGSVGSAVIVSEDGLVLTAGHVAMRPGRPVRFRFADGRRARGVTLGINRQLDSGMMRITDEGPWPHVPLAPAGSAKVGDWVVGLGQPNGYFRDRAPPVRLGRVLLCDDSTLCTDVTLVGGDSGGPLLNLKGEVVAIHSRIGSRITSNFHVPVDQYHTTWDRLVSGQMWGGMLASDEPSRYRPLLGVAADPRKTPCQITQVFPGMPAARAGVKVGDIVRQFDGEQVNSIEELSQLVLDRRGGRVTLEIERDGEEVELDVWLGMIAQEFPGAAPREPES